MSPAKAGLRTQNATGYVVSTIGEVPRTGQSHAPKAIQWWCLAFPQNFGGHTEGGSAFPGAEHHQKRRYGDHANKRQCSALDRWACNADLTRPSQRVAMFTL